MKPHSSLVVRRTIKTGLLIALVLCSTVADLTAQTRPNVLFIAVDDLRPEIGCYGNKVVKTPQIDRLAASGLVFERAYCAQAVCSPSRTAIMTGLRPDTTKVWDLNTHFRSAVPDSVTLPQQFKSQGWHCEALGKIYHPGFEDGKSWSVPHWYARGRTVDTDPADWSRQIVAQHSVQVTEYATKSSAEAKDAGSTKKGAAYEVSPKSDDQLPDGATAAQAVKRIAALKEKGEPFFLAVGFQKPHLPFVAPKQYWDLYDPNHIPGPQAESMPEGTADFVGHTNGELHSYTGVPKGNPIPSDFAKTLRHGYYACVSYTDAQIGRLLDALDQQGLRDNTIIVLWGDHGWQLGDHGLWHKHTNFELATRAPLLISVPKSVSRGQKCNAPVEFVDVYPTLTELCGLKQPAQLAGKSLKSYLDNPKAPMQKPAVSVYPRSSAEYGGNLMGYSIRNERWRATFWRKRNASEISYTELYDEQNDPAETINLAKRAEHSELLTSLKQFLPPEGSDAPGEKSASVAKKGQAPAGEDRQARFARLYPGKEKLTLDEYLAAQGGDKAVATERFRKFDSNGDGIVTRQEFIANGKPQ